MEKKSLGKDALVLSASKFITLLISMFSGMLLSRFRTLEEYGTYSQLLMAINLVSSMLMLGLPNSINYFFAKAETLTEKREFLSVFYTLSTLLSAFVGGVLILSEPFIALYFKNPAIHGYLYFLALYPWTTIIMGSIDNILIVSKKTRFLTVYRVTNSLFLLGIILFVQVFHLRFYHYMALFLCVQFLFSLWVYFIVHDIVHKINISFDKTILLSILRFSIPMGIGSAVGTLSVELDKLVIGTFMDTKSLALYANAGKELPITIVSTSITAVLIPRIVKLLNKKKNQDAISLWGDSIIVSYGIICFISTAMVVFAPQVITLLYSEKYLPGVNVFRVYNIVLLLRCTYFGMILNALGKTKFIMYSSIFSMMLNLFLNIICLKTMGFIGPAIATFLSIGLTGFAQLVFTAKEIHIPLVRLFPWKQIFRITEINAVMGMFVFIIVQFVGLKYTAQDIFIGIVIGLIWTLLYFALCYQKGKMLWRKIKSIE